MGKLLRDIFSIENVTINTYKIVNKILFFRRFHWPKSKEFNEFKEFLNKEKKQLVISGKKTIFPIKDISKGIICFLTMEDFPYNIFAFKAKV